MQVTNNDGKTGGGRQLAGRQEWNQTCKNLAFVFVGGNYLTGDLHILYISHCHVTTTSIILNSNKSQHEDILVSAYMVCLFVCLVLGQHK